jgi:outer membrane protein assembly factor BamB
MCFTLSAILFTIGNLTWTTVGAGDVLVDRAVLSRAELQPFWMTGVPLEGPDLVTRIRLIDENLYVLTDSNLVVAIHASTGVIRWMRQVGAPDQNVRGPEHSPRFAVFTTPTAVRLFHRRTGEPPSEPRALRGVITEVRGDMADINIGSLHGVRPGTILQIRRQDGWALDADAPPMRFRALSVSERESTGRVIDFDAGNRPQPGDRVVADVALPIPQVAVPFSPSAAALADETRVYFAAANRRFYALEIVHGYRAWEMLTPGSVSAAPQRRDRIVITADQSGTVIAADIISRSELWRIRVEGAVFASPVVTADTVYIASSDRSLYAFDLTNGQRRWRERFGSELLRSPAVHKDTVYQYVPRDGLVALDAQSGKQRWRLADGLEFLTRIDDAVYVTCGYPDLADEHATPEAIARLDALTGKERLRLPLYRVDFVTGGADPSAIFLADRMGRVLCVRSAAEAHLRPGELDDALRDERAMAAAAEVDAARAAERARAKGIKPETPDPFASRSTTPPAVGTGLVPPGTPPPTERPEERRPRPGLLDEDEEDEDLDEMDDEDEDDEDENDDDDEDDD